MQPIPPLPRLRTPNNKALENKKECLTERAAEVKKRNPLLIAILLTKKSKERVERAFFRIKLKQNADNAKKIMTRYLSIIVKYNLKCNTLVAMNKIKAQSLKKKNIRIFCKVLQGF